MTSKINTLATPHDAVVRTSLERIQESVDNAEYWRVATVSGVCCDHVLYANDRGTEVLYAVILTSGSYDGIKRTREAMRDFASYSVPDGNPFPLAHLLVEAAHDEYIESIS